MRLNHFIPLFFFFVVISFLLLPLISSALLNGWTPITDLQDPHVLEIAEFAVSEHVNQSNNHKLKLERVSKGEKQVVAGINYRLTLSATEDGPSPAKDYVAVVWEKPGGNVKTLTAFQPLQA